MQSSKVRQHEMEQKYEEAMRRSDSAHFKLQLYVTGMTPRSVRAIANLKSICESHLKNRYSLEVVDVYQHVNRVREDQIVAVPTLIKQLPLPLRRIVGDLSDTEQVLVGLDLKLIKEGEES